MTETTQPWLRDASNVRFGGVTFKCLANGPLPFASVPWQTAQWALYKVGPSTESMRLFCANAKALGNTSSKAIRTQLIVLPV